MKIKTIKQIDVDDWDEFISKTYGKIYSFQQQDGCKDRGIVNISVPYNDGDEYEEVTQIPFKVNGSHWGVNFETWLSTDSDETRKHFSSDWENAIFWDRNFYPYIGCVVDDLYKKGLLKEGTYQINIDW
jgi:hypothetical protein